MPVVGQAGNYTLSATSTGLTGATSATFAITVGAPTQLNFTAQPGNGTDGTNSPPSRWSPSRTVAAT